MPSPDEADTHHNHRTLDQTSMRAKGKLTSADWLIDPDTGFLKDKYATQPPCPTCGADIEKPLFKRSGFTFVRCGSCDMVYVSPRLRDEVVEKLRQRDDSRGAMFVELAESSSRERWVRQYEPMLRRVRKAVPRGKLLDVGHSVSPFLDLARDSGYIVTGVELNPHAVAHGRSSGLTIHDSSLEMSGVRSKSIDVVTLRETLERESRPRDVLMQIHRVLKPDGRLFVTTLNVDCLFIQLFGLEQAHWLQAPTWINFFSVKTLESVLHSAGFRPDGLRSIGEPDIEDLREHIGPEEDTPRLMPAIFKRFLFDHSGDWEDLRRTIPDLLVRHRMGELLLAQCTIAD